MRHLLRNGLSWLDQPKSVMTQAKCFTDLAWLIPTPSLLWISKQNLTIGNKYKKHKKHNNMSETQIQQLIRTQGDALPPPPPEPPLLVV